MVKRIEYNDGTIEYRNDNGKLHREDGPAVFHPDGSKAWYKNGKLHREDGPAVIYSNVKVYWCKNGKLHREDGPAVIRPNGIVYWYKNGVKYSFDEWREKVNISSEEKMELVLKYG